MQLTLLSFAALTAAAPTVFTDGYPNPSPAQQNAIAAQAGGSLPNAPLPSPLADDAILTLTLIAINEDFEVNYFDTLLNKVSANGGQGEDGFNVAQQKLSFTDQAFLTETIKTIRAQEEFHLVGANAILQKGGGKPIDRCEYAFPPTNLTSAIALANTFTDVVIGVLPQAQTLFAADAADPKTKSTLGLVNLLGSILAQESEQDGWFRTVQRKIAPAAPFLTTEPAQFAFSFLDTVIKPGCAARDFVASKITPLTPITVETQSIPSTADSSVIYSVPGTIECSEHQIVYISGQNLPVPEDIAVVTNFPGAQAGRTYFTASLPFQSAGFARGLTIAALVKNPQQSYASIADVAKVAAFAPAILEIS